MTFKVFREDLLRGFQVFVICRTVIAFNNKSLEIRRLIFDKTMYFQILGGFIDLDPSDFLNLTTDNRTGGNFLKLNGNMCKTDCSFENQCLNIDCVTKMTLFVELRVFFPFKNR